MQHPLARAHALHIARNDAGTVAHVVFVRQRAFEHVADDFHVAVAVGAEAAAGQYAVLVDHAQAAEAQVRGIVIIGEGKRVERLQPAVVGVAAVGALANFQHGDLLSIRSDVLNQCFAYYACGFSNKSE